MILGANTAIRGIVALEGMDKMEPSHLMATEGDGEGEYFEDKSSKVTKGSEDGNNNIGSRQTASHRR